MFEEFLQQSLADLETRHRLRRLRVSDLPAGPLVRFGGKTLHNFASNDYLGLAAHPDVIGAALEATREFGAGTGASRLVTGTQKPHCDLEEKIASFKSTASALVFSNGYAASIGTLQALAGKDDVVLLDKLSHACLVDGARLSGAALRPFHHNDADHLDHHLRWAREKHPQARVFIVTESVFSMDGDLAPLRDIVDLKDRYGATLILDEAHATGVLGRGGRGLADKLGLSNRIEVQMGTLGKALGSSGGYIAGSRALVDFLVNRARSFIFSTAAPASTAAAASAALDISSGPEGDKRRAKLRELAAHFDPAPAAAIHPLTIGAEDDTLRASEQMAQLGFHVPAIRPPTVPNGTSRLRVSLSAAHDSEVVRTLAAALRAVANPVNPAAGNPDTVCPVCGATLISEKCKVVCRSATCGYRIVFNCSEF
ncbi:MAG: 8-amino-7-oxononanoate synthase [Chthoniobacterales bacterium]|nr:8-amino-7-oxononanoate synthase [Chthoniobacterales bacterium]